MAETAGSIEPTLIHAYTHKRPGFQIGPDVAVEDCLEILQRHMRTTLGVEQFTYNVTFGTERPGAIDGIAHSYVMEHRGDSGPHIDEPEAKRNLGLVLHENLRGVGRVVLQLAKPGIQDLGKDKHGLPKVRWRDVDGPKYEGVLGPHIKTVFSEGIATTGLLRVRLGPAIHDFQSLDTDRDWIRYGWEPLVG